MLCVSGCGDYARQNRRAVGDADGAAAPGRTRCAGKWSKGLTPMHPAPDPDFTSAYGASGCLRVLGPAARAADRACEIILKWRILLLHPRRIDPFWRSLVSYTMSASVGLSVSRWPFEAPLFSSCHRPYYRVYRGLVRYPGGGTGGLSRREGRLRPSTCRSASSRPTSLAAAWSLNPAASFLPIADTWPRGYRRRSGVDPRRWTQRGYLERTAGEGGRAASIRPRSGGWAWGP